MKIGYFLSCEEFGPRELVRQAKLAEEAGFDALWISDHYHPWNDEQGNSPFVWSVIGALAEATNLPVTTAVTCPIMRIHPAVIAQAAATSSVLHEGRFVLGVGTGEALNEHILGDVWPRADVRLEMLEESIALMRELWKGGQVSHEGDHYLVENARIYTPPEDELPVYVSGFGPKAIDVAARIADGFVTVGPQGDAIKQYKDAGGTGPVQSGAKVCWGEDRDAAIRTAHRLWPNDALPGELAQVLPNPAHFEQAAELVTEEMIADAMPCGPDLDEHAAHLQEIVDAGADEVYVQQIGGDHEAFFRHYAETVLPKLRG